MEHLLRVPRAYVISLPTQGNEVHSVFMDKEMMELQVAQLQEEGTEIAIHEFFLNSALRLSGSGSSSVIYLPIPEYETEAVPCDDTEEARAPARGLPPFSLERRRRDPTPPPPAPVLSPSKRREALLELLQQYEAIVQERIGAEIDYEDTLKEYHKELEMHDIKTNSYEYSKNKLEEIYSIYKEDKRLYLTLLESKEPPPPLFLAKYRLFQQYSSDDEETEFRNYVEHYPDDDCSGLSDTFKTFFVGKDAFWKDFFSESIDDKIKKELRLKYIEAFYTDLELYKANRLDDDERNDFFKDFEQRAAEVPDYEIAKLDEYIAKFT